MSFHPGDIVRAVVVSFMCGMSRLLFSERDCNSQPDDPTTVQLLFKDNLRPN